MSQKNRPRDSRDSPFIAIRKPKEYKLHPVISAIGAIIVGWIFVSVNKSKHKSIIKATDADNYLNTGKSNISAPNDKLISSVITTRVISTSSSGGSGHIGGSSTHIGGGGHSFGGGGRHF